MTKIHSLAKSLTWISIGILLIVFLSFEVIAMSTRVSLDDLVERSDLVISGIVIGESSYRESILIDIESLDAERTPVKRVETVNRTLTDYKIEVSNLIDGSYDKSIIHLTVMGGTVDFKSTSYSHSADLTPNKEYILFLGYEKRNDKWWVVAGWQGVFEEVVTGSRVFRTSSGERLTVEQLKSRIRASTHE